MQRRIMNKIRFILCLGCLLTIICVQANDSTLNKKQVRWQRWEQNEEKNHWQIGVRMAGVASDMLYTSSYYDIYSHKPYARGSIGFWAERDIYQGFSIRPELAFTGRGVILENNPIYYSLFARYFDIRLNLIYTFLRENKFQPYVFMTPNLNFAMSGSVNYYIPYETYEHLMSNISLDLTRKNINPFNFSMLFGIGMRFPITIDDFPFYISAELGYNIGCLNTFSHSEKHGQEDAANKDTWSSVHGSRLNSNGELAISAQIPLNSFKYKERSPRPKQESWLEQRKREREEHRKAIEEQQRQQAELLAMLQQEQTDNSARYNDALAAYNQSLAPQNRVGDGIKMYVVPKVALETADDGTQEMNLKMEFTYETTPAETMNLVYNKNTDDYPAGMYLPTQSKACKATLSFIKEQLSGEMKKYFTPETKVTIKITGETDGSAIRGKIPYKGEYGDFENQLVYLNHAINDISVTKKMGITSNAQLGFLRTQGVKSFLETYIDELQITQNAYQIYVVERAEKGSQYRRISVEFTIHNAYKKELAQLSATPVQTLENSSTNEIEKIQNNTEEISKTEVSDVDTNIPVTKKNNEDTYVLIIANEHYNDIVGVVPFAENDGTIFRQYCIQTLGIPERQIRSTIDATRNQIVDGLDWIDNIAQARKGAAKFIVYYAGHGIPIAEATHLLPVDANPEKINQLLSLNDIYVRLGNLPAQSVTCFIDACFSGTRRNGQPILQGGRGLVKKPKVDVISGKLIIFSAANTEQTAYPYPEKKHGLFTYFLLKALQTSNGTINYQKLIAYLTEKVSLEASLQNRNQTPTLQYSEQIEDQWFSWTL